MPQAPFTFGQWVRQRRRAADLTQNALAELVPCSPDLIRKIEAGTRHPAPRRAVRLADCLGVPSEHRPAWLALARGVEVPSPALDALRPPSTLPSPLTALLGREAEMATVRRRLEEAALVTLHGPPGVGKSRLALAAADSLRDTFPDGVFWVDLAAIDDPAGVPLALAIALKLDNVTPANAAQSLRLAWRDRQALVVLDNFEHLLPAAAEIGVLVAACPWLKLLVTSRVALQVRGERRVPIGPLEFPSPESPLDEIARSSAVRLFVERACDAHPDFYLDEGTAATVASICARLDGLPLALELAAAQLRILDPAALLQRLGNRDLLRVDTPVDARHRSLSAAIEASVGALEPEARAFFRHLAVFPASFPLSAAETVCLPASTSALALAGTLVDAGLLYRPESGRLRLLQPLREFAEEELEAVGEADLFRDRHASWILAEAERLAADLHGPTQVAAHHALEREAVHVRTALAWLTEHDAVRGARLAVALFWWWSVRGHLAESCVWLDGCLASRNLPDPLRAAVLWRRGVLGFLHQEARHPDVTDLVAFAEEAQALQAASADHSERACVLTLRGNLAQFLGDPAGAERLYLEALALPGPRWVQRVTMGFLAGLTHQSNWVEQELILARQEGDAWAEADAQHALAMFRGAENQLEPARVHLNGALGVFRALGDRRRTAWTLVTAAGFARGLEDHASEQAHLLEALAVAREMGHLGWAAVATAALDGGPLPAPWLRSSGH